MKNDIKIWSITVCLICCIGIASAQNEVSVTNGQQTVGKQLPHEVPTPEKAAVQMTDQMQASLQLTEKQYKKIYKLNLKEQKQHFSAMQEFGHNRPPMRGNVSDMKGGENFPPMGNSVEPPLMGFNGSFGQMGARPPMNMNNDKVESLKKASEMKEKKIKKILTTEQYEKWQAEQAVQQAKHSKSLNRNNDL